MAGLQGEEGPRCVVRTKGGLVGTGQLFRKDRHGDEC